MDIIKKQWVNKLLKLELEFNVNKNRKYKVEVIKDCIVETIKAIENKLLGLYYLVSLKSYSKDESTWELVLIIMQFWKMNSIFYKSYLKKPIIISLSLNSILFMTKQII